jgi:hypothetical protein
VEVQETKELAFATPPYSSRKRAALRRVVGDGRSLDFGEMAAFGSFAR